MNLKNLLLIASLASAAGAYAQENVIIVNEGNWGVDNGSLSYLKGDKIVSESWFQQVNNAKLGDTPNDIIQANDTLIAICVNASNIVQLINNQGKAVAAIEDIPNCRHAATDGQNLYVTSFAHECTVNGSAVSFTKGYVAKISLKDMTVTNAVEVGYEPDGIAFYKGKLFVANSGSNSFSESHDFEKTVSVVDAATMAVEMTITTEQPNLYGPITCSGQYMLITSPGDYMSVQPATIILDAQAVLDKKTDTYVQLPVAANYSATGVDGNFLTIGSVYSYVTQTNEYSYHTINPAQAFASKGAEGVSEGGFPGAVLQGLKQMAMPCCLYVNPYSGYIYAADAVSYTDAGKVSQWDASGTLVSTNQVYINPNHMLALNPAKLESGINNIETPDAATSAVYDLQGRRVTNPQSGHIYIRNHQKFRINHRQSVP